MVGFYIFYVSTLDSRLRGNDTEKRIKCKFDNFFLMQHAQKKSHILAFIMLGTMLGLLVGSIRNESAIIDELAHIPAGYSYVTQLDYRLNPAHPPLLKAISGLSVAAIVHPHFPTDIKPWTKDINGQWDMGYSFIYENGNNADSIIYWARIPVILLSVLFGWLLYQWVRRRFGAGTALLTLAFFCFSPTMLAHSRYVTTDLGASFGFFIGIASFIYLLEHSRQWRIALFAGLMLGIAELLKFSLVLLVPMNAIIFILWIIGMPMDDKKQWMRSIWLLVKRIIVMLLVALAVVWAIYGAFTYNYPQERQINDATYLLGSYGFRPAVNLDLALIRNPLTRPLGQYILGVLMVQQRAAGGNTTYFLGEVSNAGSRLYFPLLYLVKELLPLHIFSFIALFYGIKQFFTWRRSRKQHTPGSRSWQDGIQRHIVEWSCVVVIFVYWIVSIKSPLNIGIRHVLPTFPFLYILISRGVVSWIRNTLSSPRNLKEVFGTIVSFTFKTLPRYAITILLLFWLVAGTLTTTPHFLSFYNELAGGTSEGWKIAVDSNYDWGQDLKRLVDFVQENNIKKIALDYFGGGVPRYYLGDRVEWWSSSRGQPKGWFAISATFRQGTYPGEDYLWLKTYPPIARAGYSIFIYKLPE